MMPQIDFDILAIGGPRMFPYGSDGVDATLIRWMLAMTPAERLATLQDFVDFVWEARGKDAEEQILLGLSDPR